MNLPSNSPVNPGLLSAMHALAVSDSPGARGALYGLLLKSVLLVPLAQRPQSSGWKKLERETPAEILTLQAPDGGVVLPVFSDAEAVLRWRPEGCPYMGISGRTLFQIAMQNGFQRVVINLAGPAGGEITRYEMEFLSRGEQPRLNGN